MTLEPHILTDKNQLQEIFNLRVEVWENTDRSLFVNRKLFPEGWSDELDKTGIHCIISDDIGIIIAAARLNCFTSLHDYPYYKSIKHLKLPEQVPFGFYSRLIVSPKFQGNGLSSKLDKAIIKLSHECGLKWLVGLASDRTQLMIDKLGFINFGTADVKYHHLSDLHHINVIVKELNDVK